MEKSLHTFWRLLWEWHDQAKKLLTFSTVNESSSEKENRKGDQPLQSTDPDPGPVYRKSKGIGLILGPLLFIATLLFFKPDGLSQEGVAVLATTLWIATWWITEAIPIPATSLLPLILFPMTGGLSGEMTASSYGDNTIFLFLGGFLIALTMQKWNLHKRIALFIISLIGTSTERIILGFMVATGFLSMWISNTATAMMMVPIGMAVIYQVSEQLKKEGHTDTDVKNFNFGKAIMLAIAYSASIGGLGTLIGTPPNTIFAAVVKNTYGIEISFALWMLFGVPVSIVLIAITWIYLVKFAFPMKIRELPGGKEVIQKEKRALGTMAPEEKIIFTVFTLTALAWITRTFILVELNENINDTIIALAAATVLFIFPSATRKGEFLLDWETAKGVPWGILLLFGGGLAIASGFKESGLAEWFGTQLAILDGVNLLLIIVIVTAMVIFLTEITSNTATATMMFPIMASLAAAVSVHPYALMIGAGLAASCAFMLPVATPPNAVVFGSGYLRIPDMAKAGFWLNIFSIVIIALAIYFYLPAVWGVDITSFPDSFRN